MIVGGGEGVHIDGIEIPGERLEIPGERLVEGESGATYLVQGLNLSLVTPLSTNKLPIG